MKMIQSSFIILEKVSHKTEQNIWEQGIRTWDDFLNASVLQGIAPKRKAYYDRKLGEAKANLRNDDMSYFQRLLPSSETWRLYEHYKDEALYLDIETSGYYGHVTVIGLYDGFETKTLVRGFNFDMQQLKQMISRYKLLVTFNGSSFDLPVLRRYYPSLIPDIPHIDLRHVCAKLNLRGGLKEIEKSLCISRELAGMDGSDAVYLWEMWKSTGKRQYIEKLVKYNEEDIVNLKPIMEYAYKELKNRWDR